MAKIKLLQDFRKSGHVEIIIALITIVIRTSDEFDVRKENVLLGDLQPKLQNILDPAKT